MIPETKPAPTSVRGLSSAIRTPTASTTTMTMTATATAIRRGVSGTWPSTSAPRGSPNTAPTSSRRSGAHATLSRRLQAMATPPAMPATASRATASRGPDQHGQQGHRHQGEPEPGHLLGAGREGDRRRHPHQHPDAHRCTVGARVARTGVQGGSWADRLEHPGRQRRARRPGRRGGACWSASAVGALNTANARQPLARQGRGAIACFFPGWLTSELPIHAIGWQALATLRYVAKGALRTPSGLARPGAVAGSWGTLARIWNEAADAPRLFEQALREGLGDELDEGRDPLPAVDASIVRRRLVSGPLANHAKPWRRARNLSYGEFGRRNHLDVWAPGRPADRRQGAGAPPGPRRRLGHRQEGAAGRAADGPHGRAGLGVRRHQLPAQPPRPPGPTTSST